MHLMRFTIHAGHRGLAQEVYLFCLFDFGTDLTLDLNRREINLEIFLQDRLYPLEYRLTVRILPDQHVGRQDILARGQAPGMQMVHTFHPWHVFNPVFAGVDVKVLRHVFSQVTQEFPVNPQLG